MKERADEDRAGLNRRQVRLDSAVERFISAQRGLADALALEVIPDELVRVQLGRIAGQKMQLQAPSETLDILRHHLGNVRGVAVEDEKHGDLTMAHEVRQQ